MSHATGAIKFKDGLIRFYEYNGTSDMVLSHHYETLDEVSENWRNGKEMECNCGREESVSIFTQYGSGFYIEGMACRYCNSVRSVEPDFDIIEREDTNDWANEILNW